MRKRNTTTEFLKECMADALLKLLAEGNALNEITIQEITSLANVGRVTYYRNFKSKEDVLYFKLSLLEQYWLENHPVLINLSEFSDMQEAAAHWKATHDSNVLPDIHAVATSLFQFILTNRSTLEILYAAHLEYICMKQLCTFIHDRFLFFHALLASNDRRDYALKYSAAAVSYALYGMINQWILDGFQETPEQMGDLFSSPLPNGLQLTIMNQDTE